MAKETADSILRHLWYLTEETVVLALFDGSVSEKDKVEMAQNLLAQPRPEVFQPGRPTFPQPSLLSNSTTLSPFIGPRTWLLFSLLGGSGLWLQDHPSQWADDDEFRRMATVVLELAVVNDAAERGVNDCTDYANVARDGKLRGRIIAVASSHRVAAPAMLKHELAQA